MKLHSSTLKDLAVTYAISYNSLLKRVQKGSSIKDAVSKALKNRCEPKMSDIVIPHIACLHRETIIDVGESVSELL